MRASVRATRAVAAVVGVATLAGCQEHEFPPPDRGQQVAEADAAFSPALFDTIAWESDTQRIEQGNIVFAAECRKCHGALGHGDTEYARAEGIEVPSLVEPEWEYGDDPEAVRRRIFAGHPAGMPTWGVAGITPREIDAVAAYITEQLRPEVLGPADGGGR
ncbi:MAG TPA: c-type cytochrome [Longimicrobiales bacterium]|nr:c-type cytochrome [Longimicrobiales bacterium]